jgi:hypothetical protein
MIARPIPISILVSELRRPGWIGRVRAAGHEIDTVQELLGRQDVSETMIQAHVLNRGGQGVERPPDGRRKTLGAWERQAAGCPFVR